MTRQDNALETPHRENRDLPASDRSNRTRTQQSRSAARRARHRRSAMQDFASAGPRSPVATASTGTNQSDTLSRGRDDGPPVPQHGNRQRLGNTGVPRRFQPQHTMNEKLVEVTKTGAQELVQSINTFISTHSNDTRDNSRNLIDYFWSRDTANNRNQEGLVAALMMMGHGLFNFVAQPAPTFPFPPPPPPGARYA
jgi:hypothetical protein